MKTFVVCDYIPMGDCDSMEKLMNRATGCNLDFLGLNCDLEGYDGVMLQGTKFNLLRYFATYLVYGGFKTFKVAIETFKYIICMKEGES